MSEQIKDVFKHKIPFHLQSDTNQSRNLMFLMYMFRM